MITTGIELDSLNDPDRLLIRGLSNSELRTCNGLPSPSCPQSFLPAAHMLPFWSTRSMCVSPIAILLYLVDGSNCWIICGTHSESDLLPRPSSPLVFLPHAYTDPSSRIAAECLCPANIPSMGNAGRFRTTLGLRSVPFTGTPHWLLSLFPLHVIRWSGADRRCEMMVVRSPHLIQPTLGQPDMQPASMLPHSKMTGTIVSKIKS